MANVLKFFKNLYQDYQKANPKPLPPTDCLVEAMTVEQAENYMLKLYDQLGLPENYSSFVKEHEQWKLKCWKAFILQIKEGDELYFFNTPEIFWTNLLGCNGFIILRGSEKKEVARLIFCRS